MSLLNNSNAIPTTSGDYNLENSLRFRESASANLLRTPATAGNLKTWTWSAWVKRGNVADSSYYCLFGVDGVTPTNRTEITFSANAIFIYEQVTTATISLTTTGLFRDPSAWYHIVVAIDTTQATSTNRVKLYVNGEQITSFSSATYPSLNYNTFVNSTNTHVTGARRYSNGTINKYFDGYLTEVNLIDGQALTPSDFGDYNENTGVWQPIEYTGTYGTNGFYLPFKPTTQATGFNTVLYTGTGAAQAITGVGFEPDLVWMKRRTADEHDLQDSVRGGGKSLISNSTAAEADLSGSYGISSFDANGFSLIGNGGRTNESGGSYAAWCWDAGSGSPVSNTDGTITSTIKANPATGFSVVSYTGNGVVGATIGHGLNSVPKMIFTKSRDETDAWIVYNATLGAGSLLQLNNTSAAISNDHYPTAPTSSVYYVNSFGSVNAASEKYIAYCFSEVAGYSKFGSYTGNGSTTGPVVTTGFKPAFVLIKKSSSSGTNWMMYDNTRSVANPANNPLTANTSDAEATSTNQIDFNSDGFQITGSSGGVNTSGDTYIYMAFADTRDAQFNFDASGNKNNWTANNINSNASGDTTYDIMTDVPTLTDEDTANYAVLNPLSAGTNANISQGNLYAVGNAVNHVGVYPTILPKTGKWYFEFDIVTANSGGFGFSNSPGPISGFPGLASGYWYIYGALTTGYSIHNELTYTSYTDTRFNTGNLGQMAIDFDTGKVWVGSNNVWINSTNGTTGNPSTGANPTWTMPTGVQYYPFMEFANPATTFAMNFGQRPFTYTPPAGYLKLNTFNLPDSSIVDGSEHFVTAVYTGNGAARSIDNTITSSGGVETGDPIQFSPGLVWLKTRNAALYHLLTDSVRGVTHTLSTNTTDNEAFSSEDVLTSFDSNGFSLTADDGAGYFGWNVSGQTMAAWNWKANGTAVSNTDGTITSQVSANPTAGFSVVTYTGSGVNATVGHGLGVALSMVIVKKRTGTIGTGFSNWMVWHNSIGAAQVLYLDTNSAVSTNASTFNSTAPTSSVFSLGTNTVSNENTATYVAYAFAEVPGYSKFGSYTGNGSADGTFVYTGFRPAYIMIKGTSTSSWVIIDNKRNGYNVVEPYVLADSPNAESSTYTVADFLSNGFKMRSTAVHNASGQTWIYMAFAEVPTKYALGR